MAEGYQALKMKRKDLDEVVDDFSDFYLTSPARKMRRLDAELPPIMEEEEPGIPTGLRGSMQVEQQFSGPLMEDVTPIPSVNEERALVLYKPMNSRPSEPSTSSSNYFITLDSDFIPGLKEHAFWSMDMKLPGAVDNKEESGSGSGSGRASNSLAIVPWTGHQFPTSSVTETSLTETTEPMEADEMMVDGMMDIEDGRVQTPGYGEGEGLQKWQLPHCMTPQLPQNTSTPLMWSW